MRPLRYLPLVLILSACAPTASQLEKTLNENPDVLFSVMEKHPEKFTAMIQKMNEKRQEEARKAADEQAKVEIAAAMKEAPLKPITPANRVWLGNPKAPITIVEYTDFQCPFCARGYSTVKQLLKEYDGKVKVLVKNLPLPGHELAVPAAERFEAIALQDKEKAVKFKDAIFSDQEAMNQGGEAYLDQLAKEVGADVARMKRDMKSSAVKRKITADMKEAEKFDFRGTPAFIVDGVALPGAYPITHFRFIIDERLKQNQKM